MLYLHEDYLYKIWLPSCRGYPISNSSPRENPVKGMVATDHQVFLSLHLHLHRIDYRIRVHQFHEHCLSCISHADLYHQLSHYGDHCVLWVRNEQKYWPRNCLSMEMEEHESHYDSRIRPF